MKAHRAKVGTVPKLIQFRRYRLRDGLRVEFREVEYRPRYKDPIPAGPWVTGIVDRMGVVPFIALW